MLPTARSLQLRLQSEINRVVRIGFALQPTVEPETAWRALVEEPLRPEDRPHWIDRLLNPFTESIHRRSYGQVLCTSRSPFFITGAVPFTAIALADGQVAVAFWALPRRDLAPVALRLAAARVFAANGWRFPADLQRGDAFAAIAELAHGGFDKRHLRPDCDPSCEPYREHALGESGEIPLANAPRHDAMVLRWTPHTLAFCSERTGIL